MNIFQIPSLENEVEGKFKLIGIIDSSGSMTAYWNNMATYWNQFTKNMDLITYCFDDKIHKCETNILADNINTYGGGSTNIYLAFQEFEKILETIPNDYSLCVLFISDGGHNVGGDIMTLLPQLKGNKSPKKINFICLGVGKGFPTQISMILKEKYHSGDPQLPAVFLIEFISDEAFKQKFEAVSKYFSFNKQRNVVPPVCVFPWETNTSKVFENQWVLSDEDKVVIDKEEMEIKEFNLNLKGIQELFRSWSQALFIESLTKGQSLQERAKKTLEIMDKILNSLIDQKKIDLISLTKLDSDESNLSFKEKAFNNFLRRNNERTKWYYDDVKALSEGQNVQKMSEFEAAKKIMVGTVVGNYQNKINNLKNVTPQQFIQIKTEFKNVFDSLKIEKKDYIKNSVFSVFLEEDFFDGLDNCKNPFDLVESFPIFGLPLKINKANNTLTDVWQISITEIPEIIQQIDSTVIVKIGAAIVEENQKKISVNCILPLITKKEEKFIPLLKTSLFKNLMTFNLLSNADLIVEDSYEALLIHCLLFSLELDESEFKKSVIERILESLKIFVANDNKYIILRDSLLNKQIQNLEETFLGKIIVCLIIFEKEFNDKQKSEIILQLGFNFMKKNEALVYEMFDLNLGEVSNNDNKIKEEIRKSFSDFKTKGALKRQLKVDFKQILITEGVNLHFKTSQLKKIKEIDILEEFVKYFKIDLVLHKELEIFAFFLKHSFEEYSKLTPEQKEVTKKEKINELNKEFIEKNFNQKKMKSFKAKGKRKVCTKEVKVQPKFFSTPKFLKLLEECQLEFQNFFIHIHKFIIPLSREDFAKIPFDSSENIKPEQNYETFLSNNTCLAPECKFYGKIQKRLSHHLACWGEYPKGFHLFVKANSKLEL